MLAKNTTNGLNAIKVFASIWWIFCYVNFTKIMNKKKSPLQCSTKPIPLPGEAEVHGHTPPLNPPRQIGIRRSDGTCFLLGPPWMWRHYIGSRDPLIGWGKDQRIRPRPSQLRGHCSWVPTPQEYICVFFGHSEKDCEEHLPVSMHKRGSPPTDSIMMGNGPTSKTW